MLLEMSLKGNMIDKYHICLANPPMCIRTLNAVKKNLVQTFLFKIDVSSLSYLGPCGIVYKTECHVMYRTFYVYCMFVVTV